MFFPEKEIPLKDGRIAILRSPHTGDAQAALEYMKITAEETPFLLRTPDEVTLTVADEEKREQEIRSLKRVGDSFKKIVVVKDNIIPWHDDDGILYIGIEQFLLDENAMDM